MAVPHEIRKLIGAEPQAHAALACGLSGPIGETHLVATSGHLHLFTRDSLVGEFTQVVLRNTPRLEPGDFTSTLHVELEDGASIELNVSSFEREDVTHVLAAARVPAPIEEPAPVEPPAPVQQPAPQQKPAQAVEAEQERDDEDEESEPEPADPQAGKSEAVYEGAYIGCGTCLVQLALFGGAVAGMWFVHTEAMHNIARITQKHFLGDGFVFVVTKVFAIIAGLYVGAKLVGLVMRLGKSRNWGGRVAFKREIMRVDGPSNKFGAVIDTSSPFELALTFVRNTSTGSGPRKVSYRFFMHVSQDGQSVVLRSNMDVTQALTEIAGLPVLEAAEPKDERIQPLDLNNLRHVARRLAEAQQSRPAP